MPSAAARTLPTMASRSNITPGITIAQLDGRARYLLQHQVPRDVALDDLATIDATPELIDQAAASARARYDQDPIRSWQGAAVADLLQGLRKHR